MKRFDYVVTIKRPDFKTIDIISLLMCFFAVAMFIYAAINNNPILVFNLVFIGLILAGLMYTFILSSKKTHIPYYSGALVLAGIAWFFQPKWGILFGVLYIIAALLEKQAKFPLEIGVDENGITINTFPKKFTEWDQLNNVIIKDDVITVDKKNDQLLQRDIEQQISPDLEKEFNEFCKSKLANLF